VAMDENVGVVGYPSEAHRDQTMYCPGVKSDMFANMYLPIWDGGLNGTPYNDDNYYAAYLYKVVSTYGWKVKYWEIWNEPDYDYNGLCGWTQSGANCNWWDQNPHPCDYQLHAPVFHYVRMLRISWEVIKTLDPSSYVCASAFGYESFLDAVMRNTDNPIDGSVTAAYPLKAGAYFDCAGFHSYPHVNGYLREWNQAIVGFNYYRHSDRVVGSLLDYKTRFQNVVYSHGYNGVQYPKKAWLVSELNIPRKMFGNYIGSAVAQRNVTIKAAVIAAKNEIEQIHWFKVAEDATFAGATNEFQLMGMYQLPDLTGLANQVMTDQGKASKTVSELLANFKYDAVRTAALNLPSTIDGGAFKNAAGQYTYVLWAKTTIDLSETASATYSFPASLNVGALERYEWDYGTSGVISASTANNIALTGSPKFFRSGTCLTPVTYYADTDGDGFGDIYNFIRTCTVPSSGYTTNYCQDCNDQNPTTYPGALETNDDVDNDCDGTIDDLCTNLTPPTVTNLTATRIVVDWPNVHNSSVFQVQYKLKAVSTWTTKTVNGASYVDISGLMASGEYELRVRTKCNNAYTTWGPVLTFYTKAPTGACAAPFHGVANVLSNTSVKLHWGFSYSMLKYGIRYRNVDSTSWNSIIIGGLPTYTLTNLTPGATYEYQVRTRCAPTTPANWTGYTNFGTFTLPPLPLTSNCLATPAFLMQDEQASQGQANEPQEVATENLHAYPNPTTGAFYLDLQLDGSNQVELFDINGRMLKTWTDVVAKQELDIAGLASGVYLLQVQWADGTVEQCRLVKH
jgi:Secretion system C-terminal sorting domain/Putative metal-binding motif/Fibronectin type III domain